MAGNQGRRGRAIDEATLRRLLTGYLVPKSARPGTRELTPAEVELLRESIGFRKVPGGVLTSANDALGELSTWCLADPTRVESLLSSPPGKLRGHLKRALTQTARDTGIARGDERANFFKALGTVLRNASRRVPPTVVKASLGRVQLARPDDGSERLWPPSLVDAGTGQYVHRALEQAVVAALSAVEGHTLSVAELRREIGDRDLIGQHLRESNRKASPVELVPDPRTVREGLGFDASAYAKQIYEALTAQEREALLALGVGDADSLAQRQAAAARALGCDEATVRRRLNDVREKVTKIVKTTSRASEKRYFDEVLAIVCARA